MSDAFEIRLVERNTSSRTLMYIKKKTNQSIGEVKRKISAGQPIYSCGLCDDKNLATLIEISGYLQNENIDVETLYNGRVEKLEVLKNVLDSHRQTAKEVGLIDEDIDY